MATNEQFESEADRLYERYVRPLERKHWGKYVAVSEDGEAVLGESVTELLRDTEGEDGPDVYIFRVGPRVVGRWL